MDEKEILDSLSNQIIEQAKEKVKIYQNTLDLWIEVDGLLNGHVNT